MDQTAYKDESCDMDKIYLDLKLLKQRINYLVHAEGGKKMNNQKTKKIKVLTTRNKRLSMQHEEIKREIQHYEDIYEKALTKIVKNKETEIQQDKKKLEDLKKKCRKLDMQVDVLPLNVQNTKTEEPKSPETTVRDIPPTVNVQNAETKSPKRSIIMVQNKKKKTLFKGKNTSIKDKIKIKIKKNTKSKKRNLSRILKEKNTRINDKIKIHIKKNKSGERELFFLNGSKTKQAFSNLVKKKENNASNFRECRITLKKLTEEQARLYTTEKQLVEQQKNQQISQESSSQTNQNKSPIAKPNWHIRIPRSVFEESQQEIQNVKLNVPDNTATVKRTRSFNR